MKIKDNSRELKFWRVPHLDDLELLHAANVTYVYPHMHEEHCVVLVLREKEITTCLGKSFG